jgi:hypothetical protein
MNLNKDDLIINYIYIHKLLYNFDFLKQFFLVL